MTFGILAVKLLVDLYIIMVPQAATLYLNSYWIGTPSKQNQLTCSRWADEATNAPEKHEEPQTIVKALQCYNVHNGGDMNGHHAAEQEAIQWGKDQDGPVVVTDGQQQEHHPKQSDHHGEQLQVSPQPHVSYPPTD